MGVKSTTVRNLVVFNANADTLTVGDLRALIDGQPESMKVDLNVYVEQADRPYESSRTQVTFEIEVGE